MAFPDATFLCIVTPMGNNIRYFVNNLTTILSHFIIGILHIADTFWILHDRVMFRISNTVELQQPVPGA